MPVSLGGRSPAGGLGHRLPSGGARRARRAGGSPSAAVACLVGTLAAGWGCGSRGKVRFLERAGRELRADDSFVPEGFGGGTGGEAVASAGGSGGGFGGSPSAPEIEPPPDAAEPEGSLFERGLPPDFEPTVDFGSPARCDADAPSLDRTLRALVAAARLAPPEARPFLRFVSVAHLTYQPCDGSRGPVSPEPSVDGARVAITELFNTFSSRPRLVVPRPLDAGLLLVQVDLRDYGWERPVTIGGEAHEDLWEVAVSRAGQAVQYQGVDAAELRELTGTATPLLLSGDLAYAAYQDPELYYAAIDAPQTLAALRRRQGAVSADLSGGAWVAAGTATSVVSRQDRRIARYLEGAEPYWEAADFAPGSELAGPLLDPLADEADAYVALSVLPNGLPAFFAADGAGARGAIGAFLLDTLQNDFVARVPVSCAGCHAGGILPVADEVRPLYEPSGGEPAEPHARVLRAYPLRGELEAAAELDSEPIRALRRSLGLPPQFGLGPQLSLQHDRDLFTPVLAAELFVDEATLVRRAKELPRELAVAVLGGGIVSRRSFERVYLEALCALGTGRNQPAGCP